MPLSDFWPSLTAPRKSAQTRHAPMRERALPYSPLAATQPDRRPDPPGPWRSRCPPLDRRPAVERRGSSKWKGPNCCVKILDSEVSPDEPASLAAFSAGLDEADAGSLDALLRERLPEDRLAAAHDCWDAIERRDLLRRRETPLARMRDPNLSPGEITEIQKQILDLQKLITDISRPLSPSGPE